ncbi:hypothetical protein [Pedobacter rhizosphaerae]|uniref:Type IV pili methyl-accepting chemotaxis transducer N-term n=1 Tax=Pedobacter rhizosphaerae TaxID=390241 RepID=A0A1H9N568_9SPHI|nr:hypothetical protein [Pedobacter rhizosphaerae]SER30961.1 hypothetical protein SAMN04488023_10744 [Pedobacter rhizosphaerae]
MKVLLTGLLLLVLTRAFSQQVVLDKAHLSAVMANGAMRSASESLHHSYLQGSMDHFDQIKMRLAPLISTQELIFRSLSQVDGVLRDALIVKEIIALTQQNLTEAMALLNDARQNPQLSLFAESSTRMLLNRSSALYTQLAEFVLKESPQALINHESRDALLKKISLELKVIRTLLYSARKSMFWAQVNGFFRTVNPYRGFIARDKQLADDILYHLKTIKK